MLIHTLRACRGSRATFVHLGHTNTYCTIIAMITDEYSKKQKLKAQGRLLMAEAEVILAKGGDEAEYKQAMTLFQQVRYSPLFTSRMFGISNTWFTRPNHLAKSNGRLIDERCEGHRRRQWQHEGEGRVQESRHSVQGQARRGQARAEARPHPAEARCVSLKGLVERSR